MKKTTRCGTTWEYPLDKKTNFKCEGYRGLYTIIDAATYRNEVYVLLEHNDYGDETPFLLAVLPCACLRWYVVEKMNGKQEKSFFVRERDILEDTYEPIDEAIDEHYNGVKLEDIEFWTDEEINNMEVI